MQTNTTTACTFFNRPGGCKFGTQCRFAHQKQQQQQNATSTGNGSQKTHRKQFTRKAADKASTSLKQQQPPQQYVVHCRSEFDVYIGRYNPTIPENKTLGFKWGNPFKIGPHGTRDDVIQLYDEWIRSQPDLIEQAKRELKGKVLACWCSPEACHGDVLARIANYE